MWELFRCEIVILTSLKGTWIIGKNIVWILKKIKMVYGIFFNIKTTTY
jgi:hypothetical protein